MNTWNTICCHDQQLHYSTAVHLNNILSVIHSSKFLLFLQGLVFPQKTPNPERSLNQSLCMNFSRYDYTHIETRMNIVTEEMFVFKSGQEKEESVNSSQRGKNCNTAISQI